MSFTKLEFTKHWTDPEDFPTFEDSEEQVREDMQCLFDECRDGVNRLAGEIIAENIPFRRGPGIDAVTVQNALEVLRDAIVGVTLGEVPDYSIVGEKLAEGSVTESKLSDNAVTTAKIADGAVVTAKLAQDAVSTEKLKNGAVTVEKVADGTLTLAKFADGALAGKADLDKDFKVLPEQRSSAIVNVGTTRPLALTDAGKLLNVIATEAVTLTIPANSTAEFPVGTEIEVFRAGTGAVSVAGASDVTVQAVANNMAIPAQYGRIRLKKMAVNTWAVEDELAGTAKLADSAVTTAKLANGAVTTAKLANNAVTTAQITDGAVTYAKTSGVQQKHTTVTVSLPVSSWSTSNTITVTANGVTAGNTVFVSPALPKSNREAFFRARVYCTAQGTNTLTFAADVKPTEALSVNVMIFNT